MLVHSNCRKIFQRSIKSKLISLIQYTTISFKVLFFVVNVAFLEVEVHIAKIHLLGLNIASLFWLASFCLEMVMLMAIGDNLHLPIFTLFHVACFEDALE